MTSAAPPFPYLPLHFAAALRTAMERRTLPAGSIMTVSDGRALFVVERGALVVDEGGRRRPLEGGASFGDLFAKTPVMARAMTDSVLLVLRFQAFERFVVRHPPAAMHIMAGLARELGRLNGV